MAYSQVKVGQGGKGWTPVCHVNWSNRGHKLSDSQENLTLWNLISGPELPHSPKLNPKPGVFACMRELSFEAEGGKLKASSYPPGPPLPPRKDGSK